MASMKLFTLLLSAALALANPFPQETPSPTTPPSPYGGSETTDTTSSLITTAPGLTCTGGSTVLFTRECTYGFPVSYCHSPEPPISCGPSSYPSVWAPARCVTASTCYPVDADWLTSECTNGGIAYSTATNYQGTLADGQSTTITNVYCSCAPDQYYSHTQVGSNYELFCMPTSSCPEGMTTSTSTNTYCATATCDADVPLTTDYCQCAPGSTAVYTEGPASATAVGCEAV